AALLAGAPFLLTVGSVMPHKNVHTLIDAVRICHARGRKDIRLLIAGEAPADRAYATQIRAQIAANGLQQAVELLGHLDRPELAAQGVARAAQFSWARVADDVYAALADAASR